MTTIHRLRHLFGWNTGHVYSWWDSDTGYLMTGFRCADCETIEHVASTGMWYGPGVLGSQDPAATNTAQSMERTAHD